MVKGKEHAHMKESKGGLFKDVSKYTLVSHKCLYTVIFSSQCKTSELYSCNVYVAFRAKKNTVQKSEGANSHIRYQKDPSSMSCDTNI